MGLCSGDCRSAVHRTPAKSNHIRSRRFLSHLDSFPNWLPILFLADAQSTTPSAAVLVASVSSRWRLRRAAVLTALYSPYFSIIRLLYANALLRIISRLSENKMIIETKVITLTASRSRIPSFQSAHFFVPKLTFRDVKFLSNATVLFLFRILPL